MEVSKPLVPVHTVSANSHSLNEQISNFVLNWERLGYGQYEREMSTERNACLQVVMAVQSRTGITG